MLPALAQTTPTFRPLPDTVKIKPSNIDGVGLFATQRIPSGYLFGITHVFTKDSSMLQIFPDGWVRSPLGAWYNHSDTPNCISRHTGDAINPVPGDVKFLTTLRVIMPGEEILVRYTLYTPVP